jgi:hypothetical protein
MLQRSMAPAMTVFRPLAESWRYVDSCGINQAGSLIKVMRILRERAWCQIGIRHEKVHVDIDTTVETVFGNQQGGRKGHNTKYRGKKGYRPILCFIEETREYLVGKLRKGKTTGGEKTAGFEFIIANKKCDPSFRIFCTNLKGKAHKIIEEYDKRADVENLIGEAKREGLDAIPSAKFKTNYAFFQIVMLAYNIWRYIKLMAQNYYEPDTSNRPEGFYGIVSNTIRIARLKLLYISGKIVSGSNTTKVKYSIHDSRTADLIGFLKYLDRARSKLKSWVEEASWPYRFSINTI